MELERLGSLLAYNIFVINNNIFVISSDIFVVNGNEL